MQGNRVLLSLKFRSNFYNLHIYFYFFTSKTATAKQYFGFGENDIHNNVNQKKRQRPISE
jgi:hypothetical protein